MTEQPIYSPVEMRAKEIQEKMHCSWDYALQEARRVPQSRQTCTFPGKRDEGYYCPIHGNH